MAEIVLDQVTKRYPDGATPVKDLSLTIADGEFDPSGQRLNFLIPHVRLGKAGFIRGAWVKPGAVVIDAGMNKTPQGWAGDVEFEAATQAASFITPVPGGVGPVTTAIVLANTVYAARSFACEPSKKL